MWERQEMGRCAYPYQPSAQPAARTLSPLQRQAARASGGGCSMASQGRGW